MMGQAAQVRLLQTSPLHARDPCCQWYLRTPCSGQAAKLPQPAQRGQDCSGNWRLCAAFNGSTQTSPTAAEDFEESSNGTVEMFIMEDRLATTSLEEEDQASLESTMRALERRKSMKVAPPRGKPLPQGNADGNSSTALQHAQSAQTKKLRVELSMAQADLQANQAEMRQASATIKSQDRELARLRAALAERDERLRDSKAETSVARSALQAKEGEMQQAYEHLTAACSERSAIRQALIDSQAEAADLRSELQSWTQDLYELRNVIDSLDEGEETAAKSRSSSASGAAGVRPDEQPGDMGSALKLLKDLTELSQQIASDAKEDAHIFAQAAAAKAAGRGDRSCDQGTA